MVNFDVFKKGEVIIDQLTFGIFFQIPVFLGALDFDIDGWQVNGFKGIQFVRQTLKPVFGHGFFLLHGSLRMNLIPYYTKPTLLKIKNALNIDGSAVQFRLYHGTDHLQIGPQRAVHEMKMRPSGNE